MEKKNFFYTLTLKSLFKTTNDMIFVKDKDFRYVTVSQTFAALASKKLEDEVIGKTDYELFDRELADKYRADDEKILSTGKDISRYIEPLPEKDGHKKYCATAKYVLRDENGEIVGLYGVSRDITAEIELVEQREKREQSTRLFEAVLEADLTNNKMIQAEGFAWIRELDLKENSSFDETVTSFIDNFIDVEYAKAFKKYYDRETLLNGFSNGIASFSHECSHSMKGIKAHYIELESRLHFSRITNSVKMTTFIKDIDEEFKKKEELKKKALTDNLTGVHNREGFEIKVKERTKNKKGQRALIFMDLDEFKTLNDTYGHLYGDKVIVEIASKLKNFNNSKHVVGRFGGDEFVILTAPFAEFSELKQEVKRVLQVAQYYKFDNNAIVNVTSSVGATIFDDKKSLKELYAEADAAMYSAKQKGKNCFAFFSDVLLSGK